MSEYIIYGILAVLILHGFYQAWSANKLIKKVRELGWETYKIRQPLLIGSVNTTIKDSTGESKPFDYIPLYHVVHMIIQRFGLAYKQGNGTYDDPDSLVYMHKGLNMETCICAAIKTTCGKVIRGHRHHDCIATIQANGIGDLGSEKGEQGFVTSTGRFVTREEGYELQVKAGIESIAEGGYRGRRLFSEDLY